MCGAFRRTARKFSFPSSLVLLIIKQVPCQRGYKKCLLVISWYCDREIAGMWCCIFATGRGFPATSVRFYAAKENSSWQGFLSYWYYIRKNSLWWNGVGWRRKVWCKNATPKNSILWKKYFKNSLHKLELSEKTPNPSWREYFFKECMCPKRPQTGIW